MTVVISLKLIFPMVTEFFIDHLHTVIERAFGRRLEGFVSVPAEGKLSSAKITGANKRIKFFHLCRPYGFDPYVDKLENTKTIRFASNGTFLITSSLLSSMEFSMKTF
jgi:hypothetical protein